MAVAFITKQLPNFYIFLFPLAVQCVLLCTFYLITVFWLDLHQEFLDWPKLNQDLPAITRILDVGAILRYCWTAWWYPRIYWCYYLAFFFPWDVFSIFGFSFNSSRAGQAGILAFLPKSPFSLGHFSLGHFSLIFSLSETFLPKRLFSPLFLFYGEHLLNTVS